MEPPFIDSAPKGWDIWCTQKQTKVWYPYILGSYGVHYRNISSMTEESTWASPR
jgi:hypothetical protein